MATAPHKNITIISHNLWLIPFLGPSFLGREDKCSTNLANTPLSQKFGTENSGTGANTKPLVIFAVQEAWGFRCGLIKPFLSIIYYLQKYYLEKYTSPSVNVESESLRGLRLKSCDPLWLKLISFFMQLFILITHFIWLFLSNEVLDSFKGIYCPKKRISMKVRNSKEFKNIMSDNEESWDSEMNKIKGHNLFRTSHSSSSSSYWPFQPIMDSGLLLISSQVPDEHGFESYKTYNDSECCVNKGMLWARYGDVVVLNTHMTAEFNEKAKQLQSEQMSKFIKQLFSNHSQCNKVLKTNVKVCHILLVGDFNHFESSIGSDILPSYANTDVLFQVLGDGLMNSPLLLSKKELTNEDGCIDHVIGLVNNKEDEEDSGDDDGDLKKYIYLGDDIDDLINDPKSKEETQKKPVKQPKKVEEQKRYHAVSSVVFSDPDWHISDHYKVMTELELR